jgi:hypothetical protein
MPIMVSMSSVLEDTVALPPIVIWSIFGQTRSLTQQEVQDSILAPMLEDLGIVPHRILLPAEGNSSIYLQEWAESLRIQTQVFYSDWTRHGRMAQILRDDRMRKECTHALVFLSPKSNRLEKMAEAMCKKGKIVFTSSSSGLTKLVAEPLPPASARARKSDKGTMRSFLKCQSK